MPTIRSFGVKVKIATIAVGGRTSVKVPGAEVNHIDTTDHDATSGWKTSMGGLLDGGELPLAGNYIPTDVGQVYIQANPGVTAAFEVTLSNGDKFTGNIVVGKFELDNPLDDKVTYSNSNKVTGPVTFTAAA